MKTFWKTLRRQDGFTLVELMVVVAIIGLLSAIAIPNFRKYQAKSKTSEAKLQLSAIYTAMQSWYSDYDNYANCLNQMGYDPLVESLQRYYATGFPIGSESATPNQASRSNGAPTNCADGSIGLTQTTVATSASNVSAFGAGKKMANLAALEHDDVATGNIPQLASPTVTTFTAGAIGIIDASKTASTTADAWTINQDKRILQGRTGY